MPDNLNTGFPVFQDYKDALLARVFFKILPDIN